MKQYYYTLIVFIIALVVAFCSVSKGDALDSTHQAAHFGTSFALNAFTYGLSKKAFHLTNTESFIFSAFTTLTLGAAYEYMRGTGPVRNLGTAMEYNALGVSGFGLCVQLFDF